MDKRVRLSIIGCGAIGTETSKFLDRKFSKKVSLKYIFDTDPKKEENLKNPLKNLKPRHAENLSVLFKNSDIVLETAATKAVRPVLEKACRYRKDVIILSAGGLINETELLNRLNKKGVKVYIPSGAVCGIDGISAFAQERIKKLTLLTSKPPEGLKGIAYLEKRGIDLDKLTKPLLVFKGPPQKAVKYFPKNINVSSILSLSSQFKKMTVAIKAVPGQSRNIHEIILESSIGKIEVKVENIPSKNNPKTSALAIASVKALITKLFSSLKIGT